MSFFAVYLLLSLKQRASGAAVGATYIGFTANPQRRIRQHNGDIVNGAKKTSRHRPWEMVLVCFGFPSQRDALQFEWAWQHPHVSIAVREVAATLPKRGLSGVKGKVRLLMEMLHLEKWRHMPLQVQFLSSASLKYLANCPAMPSGMDVGIATLEALPTTCPDDFDLEDSGSISTSPFENSDRLPAALAADAVQDCATSPSPALCQTQCAPPKRWGRPPKAAAPAVATAKEVTAGVSPAKAARPRGRPRKATAAADSMGSPDNIAEQPKPVRKLSGTVKKPNTANSTGSAKPTGASRTRTASPRSSNGRQHSASSPAGKRSSSAAAAVTTATGVAPPDGSPKRARGRPRKHPATPAADALVTADSPIVLSASDSEPGSPTQPSPASRGADSGCAADSLSSASCIDLLSDVESDTPSGAAEDGLCFGTASPAPARDTQGRGLLTGSKDAVPQRAADPYGTAPMCTPQPARKGVSSAAPALPCIAAAEVAPMLTPQPAQQLEAALSPMLCSPPMASPPAYNSSPGLPVLSFDTQQTSPLLRQEAATVKVPVISLLTPE